ncbi:MAG: alpha/beta hydrolase [Leptolyngbyaceae bacterium]|nr:alpha/beta hydrolase [Leptolyngbyaceae bacterium]
MPSFQPPEFEQRSIPTTLGTMVYYTPRVQAIPGETPAPPLVFLHSFGGGASAYEWSKVYPAFAETHPVFAPDLIGWGESAHPVRDYQVQDYLTTLAEFIQQVTEVPVAIAASSLTGALAIRLAIQRPDLFHSLFLVCPSGFADFGQDAGRRLPLQLINAPYLSSLIYTLGATNAFAVRNFLERFLFVHPERVTEEMVAAYLASAQQVNAEYAALAFLRGDLYFDLARYLEQLTVPTTMLWGEEAQFTNVRLGRRLANLNPKAIGRFEALPDLGVLPHLEQPVIVINALKSHLTRS